MLKLMIVDRKENSDIAAAILKRRYDIITSEGKGLKERLLAEKPDLLMIATDVSDINYKQLISDSVRRTPGFENMPIAFLSNTPANPALLMTANIFGAIIIGRPYEPVKFVGQIASLAEKLVPVKERLDPVTGLHKREYTEEHIQQLFDKKSGTLFIIDVAKFRFASQPISDEISEKSAEVVIEEGKTFGAIIGVQKDRKLIGYLPGINERAICQSWAKNVIRKIQEKLEGQKVYVSIGFACNDEKTPEYIDLYQLCDRALNLSRERGSNTSAYY